MYDALKSVARELDIHPDYLVEVGELKYLGNVRKPRGHSLRGAHGRMNGLLNELLATIPPMPEHELPYEVWTIRDFEFEDYDVSEDDPDDDDEPPPGSLARFGDLLEPD